MVDLLLLLLALSALAIVGCALAWVAGLVADLLGIVEGRP